MQTQHMHRGLARIIAFGSLLFAYSAAGSAQPVRPAEGVSISLSGAAVRGSADAPVTMVEFADYQCPVCSQHFNWTLGQILDEYVKSGKVRHIFRDYPLQSIHPLAAKAAEATHCAADQGKYWEMHDRLLRSQVNLTPDALPLHAEMIGVNPGAFQDCISSGKYEHRVRESKEQGRKAGIKGTPWTFLGLTRDGQETFRPSIQIEGAQPVQQFRDAIDRLLREADRRSP